MAMEGIRIDLGVLRSDTDLVCFLTRFEILLGVLILLISIWLAKAVYTLIEVTLISEVFGNGAYLTDRFTDAFALKDFLVAMVDLLEVMGILTLRDYLSEVFELGIKPFGLIGSNFSSINLINNND